MFAKTRVFGGKRYTFGGQFDRKYGAENAADHLRYKSPFVRVRIIRVESHAPPQGYVFWRLYYRYYEPKDTRIR